jgi:hypothetical protein
MKEIGKLVGGRNTDYQVSWNLFQKEKANNSLDFIFKEKMEETW